MKEKCCIIAMLMLAVVFWGCATNEVHRASESGLEISGKKLYVLVNEVAMHEDLTQKLDSVWNATASDLDSETEFIYNEKESNAVIEYYAEFGVFWSRNRISCPVKSR